MRRVWAGSAALAMAVVGAVVLTASPASAQVDCTGVMTASPATVTPSSLMAGEILTITGGGFDGDQPLGIGLFNPPRVLGTVASDFHGFYRATVQLPFDTPPGQNEITVFGLGPYDACHQSLGLFSVKAPPPPSTVAPILVTPATVTPSAVTVTGAGGVITVTGTGASAGATPAPIVVQQPLARTGSASVVLVAVGLLAVLLGLHVVRVTGRGRAISG